MHSSYGIFQFVFDPSLSIQGRTARNKQGNHKERETTGPDTHLACEMREMRGMPAGNELRSYQRRQLWMSGIVRLTD